MTTLTLGPLAQIARTVRDIKESEAWYGATLGLPHLYTFGSLAFFDCGGTRLMLSAQEKPAPESDRKSTRLNSSHSQISYAVFCLKKKIIGGNIQVTSP